MAKLPAKQFGGIELLLNRLDAGEAIAADQKWAAELLRRASLKPHVTEREFRRFKDWGLYWQIRGMLDGGLSREEAYARLEGEVATRYRWRDSGGRVRGLNRETIKARFLEMERRTNALDEWAAENPELLDPFGFEDS